MYTAKIENVNGEVMLLTNKESKYQVVSITGLNPPKAQINTTPIVGLDGAKFNSSKLETRNIVITIRLNSDVEANRQALYNFFVTKKWCRFYYTNGSRNVYIDGYVDSVECDLFSSGEMAQISIICTEPYFKALTVIETDMSLIRGLFTFPFSINDGSPIPFSQYESSPNARIYNPSDGETGIIFKITVNTNVSSIKIEKTNTNEYIELNNSFLVGDEISINTNAGNKSIKLTRNSTVTDLLSKLTNNSVFFQLNQGYNNFSYTTNLGESDNEDLTVSLLYRKSYRGV